MPFSAVNLSGTESPVLDAANSIRGATAIASPGASSKRCIRTAAIAIIRNNTSHDTVIRGNANKSPLVGAGRRGGVGGRIVLFMNASIFLSSIFAVTAQGAGARAVWVVAFAFLALACIDRMKPATPRRTAVVRVDNKPTPLYKEPAREQKWRALANLSAGAILLGALVACTVGFLLTIAFEFVGGLLQA